MREIGIKGTRLVDWGYHRPAAAWRSSNRTQQTAMLVSFAVGGSRVKNQKVLEEYW